MKLMDLLVTAYAPLVARFHLIDGPAAARGPAERPPMPRAKRAWLRNLRAQIARTRGPRWRTA